VALPKRNRLRHRQDFSAVYQGSIRRSTPHLTLRALKPQEKHIYPDSANTSQGAKLEQPVQIGISISQKVSKRAVIRNRIKRQIRAAMRQLLPQLSSGWQLVIVVRPEATQCDYEQILRELKQLLADAEVLNGNSRGSLL
jgi:ribonuclease P protein component